MRKSTLNFWICGSPQTGLQLPTDQREDRTYAYQHELTRETTGLLESPNEVTVKANGIIASALLYTGSTVSTVSESFYLQYLGNQHIQTLNRILHIECADGEEMPYLGYITVDFELPGTSTSDRPQHCLLLAVPDSMYNSSVPLMIGTNILKVAIDDAKQRFGVRSLQEAELFTSWYATKGERPAQEILTLIKCAENKDTLLTNYHTNQFVALCNLQTEQRYLVT